jgi:hypothetical protein
MREKQPRRVHDGPAVNDPWATPWLHQLTLREMLTRKDMSSKSDWESRIQINRDML